jgi:hypothetical protein
MIKEICLSGMILPVAAHVVSVKTARGSQKIEF